MDLIFLGVDHESDDNERITADFVHANIFHNLKDFGINIVRDDNKMGDRSRMALSRSSKRANERARRRPSARIMARMPSRTCSLGWQR